MTTAVKNMFGNGDLEQQRAASQRQAALVEEERARLKAVQDGQATARNAGRGLLAFVDGSIGLPKLLGGSA